MDKDYLFLARAALSRPSGEWNDDDFDVLANGEVVGLTYTPLCGEICGLLSPNGWSGTVDVSYTYTPVAAVPLGPPPFWLNLLAGLGLVGWLRRLKQKVTAQA
jgi:hypothetical protein